MAEQNSTDSGLELWLHTATRDLCDKAKGRLYEEYGSHYADAVEAALAAGAPRTEAEAAALAGLGDPVKARRALNRLHLTRDDIIFLYKRIKPDKAPEGWRATVKAFVKFSIFMVFVGFMFSWQLVLACSVMIALNRNLAPLHPKWIALRTALMITTMLDFISWAIILVMLWGLFKQQAFWAWAVVFFCGGGADLWRSFTIMHKLGCCQAVADDFEPPHTLSA